IYWAVSPWGRIQNVMLLLAGYYIVWLAGIYPLLVLLSWSTCVYLLVPIAGSPRYGRRAGPVLPCLLVGHFFLFKYYSRLNDLMQTFPGFLHVPFSLPAVSILLPLGLSFYLFNTVSLVLSVARREMAKPSIMDLLLYLNFIATLIAGPVNRATELMPQITASR